MKYLSSLTIMILVYLYSYQATAQSISADICSPSWWQMFIQRSIPINNITINDLRRRCDQDGNTPLMIGYAAGADNRMMTSALELALTNTVQELFLIENTHGESAEEMFVKRYDPDSRLFLSMTIDFVIIERPTRAPLHLILPSADICDILWWQQFEFADDISFQDINNTNIDSLYYRGCTQDGDTPLMIAFRENIDAEVIIKIIRLATINTLIEFFRIKNTDGQTFPKMFLKEHNPEEATLLFNVDMSIAIRGQHFPILLPH